MTAFTANLPKALAASRQGDIAILRRPNKRNALNDTLVVGLKAGVKGHSASCRGRSLLCRTRLSELTETRGVEGIEQSRM
jgi:hypothetical protein